MIERLVANGYLPKELPPTFHSAPFAEFISQAGELDLHPSPGNRNLVSLPGVHNLGRPGQVRRKLQLCNPFNFYELCRVIEDGWDEISTHLDASSVSLSRPCNDPLDHRALVTERSGNDLPVERARVRAGARFLLRTDVARFYHSIYTHSIPWALHGKGWAKANRSGGLGNELDRALRNGQDGQTLGIPIGPDSSLVIAEIVACSLDRAVGDLGTDRFRFIDDFEVGFVTRSEAERGLARIQESLADFELALNPLKTAIEPLPQELMPAWRGELRDFEFSDYDDLSQRDLLRYFNRVFALSLRFPADSVIAYAVGRLRAINVGESDWRLYENLLLQCAIAEPASLPTVLGQLSRHHAFGVPDGLRSVLEEIVVTHARLGHGSEVAWAIWSAIWFSVELSSDLDDPLAAMDDPAVALLALHACDEGLMSLPNAREAWAARITHAELYDRSWLLAYEALRMGWLTSAEETEMRNDPNFGPLLDANVSFYDVAPGRPVAYLFDATGYGDFILGPGDDGPVEPPF